MIPHIRQADGQTGFYWVTPDGQRTSLPGLMATDAEPLRLLPTHLSALDDALIDAAGRWGEVLGGGRPVRDAAEAAALTGLYLTLERLNHEYAAAERLAPLLTELRAGQIVGTSALLAIRARMALGVAGPVPFDGDLAVPSAGVMSGHGQFQRVGAAASDRAPVHASGRGLAGITAQASGITAQASGLAGAAAATGWRGGRWVLAGTDGCRYPLTLAMVLAGSGTEKDGALDEHRDALRALTSLAGSPPADADRAVLAGALEWLLYDWLMAHRENERSAAIEIRSGRTVDAAMIVHAAAALAAARARAGPV